MPNPVRSCSRDLFQNRFRRVCRQMRPSKRKSESLSVSLEERRSVYSSDNHGIPFLVLMCSCLEHCKRHYGTVLFGIIPANELASVTQSASPSETRTGPADVGGYPHLASRPLLFPSPLPTSLLLQSHSPSPVSTIRSPSCPSSPLPPVNFSLFVSPCWTVSRTRRNWTCTPCASCRSLGPCRLRLRLRLVRAVYIP